MNDIHHRIKALRLAKKMSMEALAAQVGVTWQTIQQWEKNTAPKRLRLNKVAAALETSSDYLLNGNASRPALHVLEESRPPAYIHPDPQIALAVAMMEATDDVGRQLALAGIRVALHNYHPAKTNHAG